MKMSLITKPRFLFILLISMMAAGFGIAESGAKFGYFNLDAAVSQELEAQKAIKDLEAKERAILEGEQKARTEIEAKMAKYRESQSKLSEKAKAEAEAKLGKEISALQDQFTKRRADLNQERQTVSTELENKNRLILDSVAKNGKFTAVFNSAALVYASEEIKKNDVTAEVVKRYNQAYPVKPDAAKKPDGAKTTPVSPSKKP